MPSLYKRLSLQKHALLYALFGVMMLLNVRTYAQWGINGQLEITPGSKYTYTPTYNGTSNYPYCGEFHYAVSGGFVEDHTYLNSYDGSIDCSGGNGSLKDAAIDIIWFGKSGEVYFYDENWSLITSVHVESAGYDLTGPINISPGVSYKYSLRYNGSGSPAFCPEYIYIYGGYLTSSGTTSIEGGISCSPNLAMDIDVTWTSNSGWIVLYDANYETLVEINPSNNAGPLVAGYLGTSEVLMYAGDEAPLIMGSGATGGGGPNCYFYFWEHSTDGVNWNYWDGGYGIVFQYWYPGFMNQSGYLRRGVADCNDNIAYTSPIHYDVYPRPTAVNLSPSVQGINKGSTAAKLTCTVSGGRPYRDYYWQSSTDNINWTDLYWSTDYPEYQPGVLNSTMYYRVIVDDLISKMTSNTAVVSMCEPLGSIGGSTICVKGSSSQLTSNLPGGQWRSSNDAIAKVDDNGVVTGMAEGPVVITYAVTTACGSLSAQLGIKIVSFKSRSVDLGKGIDDPVITDVITLQPNTVKTTEFRRDAGQSLAHTINNVLALRVIEETDKYIPGDFTATIDLQLEYGHSAASVCKPEPLQLTVNYSKTAGVKYDALSYFKFKEAEFTRVTVVQVNAPQTINGVAFDAKQVLELTNTLAGTRYYQLADNKKPVLSYTKPVPGIISDALKVNWTIPANTYNNGVQLEWAWLENEMSGTYSNGNGVDANLLFKTGATRIDLFGGAPCGNYEIPLLYDGVGKLYMRIRAVSTMPSGSRSDGPWSDVKTFAFCGHNDSLNWQATTSYAEEGKHKTVIQYYDGSLRARQTVTKDNTTGQTVVAETMYDMEGRPAVQILPAPGIDNIIAYTKKLNKFINQPDGANPADYFDFTTPSLVGYETTPLDSSNGAAKYYSLNNADATSGYHKDIPAANGYAYSVTRYTPDATGRVMRQSDVGDSHKMGSGHEMKYFYGTPAPEELDALFGTEVGNYTHYFKNMVQDANGQMSVNYLDMKGRTIATALTGAVANMEALPINDSTLYSNQAKKSLTRNLLTKESNILKGSSIESINSILVPAPTDYHFVYSLNKQTLTLPACNSGVVSYDCKFDLQISITDESGEKAPVVFTDTAIDNKSFDEIIHLDAGSYSVRKTLVINQVWLENFIAKYIASGVGLCTTQQDLITTIVDHETQQSGCNDQVIPLTSSKCMTDLGSFDTYLTNYAASINKTKEDISLEQRNDIKSQYDAAVAFCSSLDLNTSHTLQTIRQQMLGDMVPYSGQYALENGSGPMYNRYNIFSINGDSQFGQPFYKTPRNESRLPDYYYNDYGNVDPSLTGRLQGMTNDDFEQEFKDSWAKSLLPYHPEFKKLQFAEDNLRDSYNFIDNLQANGVASDPINADPFFSIASRSTDKADIISYSNVSWPAAGNYSMWQLAYGDALGCKTITDGYLRNNCYINVPRQFTAIGTTVYTASGTVVLNAAIQSQAWNMYKAFYSQVRGEMVSRYINGAVAESADNDALITAKYKLHFPTDYAQEALNNDWTALIPDAGGNFPPFNMEQEAAKAGDHCKGYIDAWRQALLECPDLADSPNKEEILNAITSKMLEVCRNGTDVANPYGASTVGPAHNNATYTSFEQVVNSVLESYQITRNQFCNPYGIQWPKQYGQNPTITKQIVTTVETCNCEQWAKLRTETSAAGYDINSLTSINQYLSGKYHDVITSELYNGLLKCGQSMQSCIQTGNPCSECFAAPPSNCTTIYSLPLLSPQPLPAFLSCGFNNKCYNCGDFKDLEAQFYGLFGKKPFFGGNVPDSMIVWNDLFAKYVNYKTGLQHNWVYYATQFNNSGCTIGDIPEHEGSVLSICLDSKPLNDAAIANPPSPCDEVRNRAVLKAELMFDYLQQQAIARFRAAYLEKCIGASETFTVKYALNEYHYTLYYYDQAGNLVKTVPPKGVNPDYSDKFLSDVKAEREKMENGLPYKETTPSHSLETRYWYNSLNTMVMKRTPDAGVSRFWYDRLGRPAVSQDAKQLAQGNAYKYTRYDELGRVWVTTQQNNVTPMTDAIAKDEGNLYNWFMKGTNWSQYTQTHYDEDYAPLDGTEFRQNNLRNRVSYIEFLDDLSTGLSSAASYYSYDVHGNVDALLQDFGSIDGKTNIMNLSDNRFKKIEYDYDLISNKVTGVNYQAGHSDAYYQRYEYDGENRITDVYSGRDEVMLRLFPEREAHYDYYKHGSLARTTLGQLGVQKQDYVYTLQGWLKGINPVLGGTLANGTDITEEKPVAQDAYGFSLHYFKNDYKAIGHTPQGTSILGELGSNGVSLYNGNIAAMAVNIPSLGGSKVYNYHYDQLNRLIAMDAFNGLNVTAGSFSHIGINDYKERISYDANGNILTYKRNGDASRLSMDDLRYFYKPTTNQLHKVTDAALDASTANYSNYNDIKQGQGDSNYVYDEIGNLIEDHAEGITNITWTMNGKIASITKAVGVTKYSYDVAGNRILKETPTETTAYVRDASGNVISVYSKPVGGTVAQTELHLYGSSRIGMTTRHDKPDMDVVLSCGFTDGVKGVFTRGEKLYELGNHLGNVLVTISDKKIAVSSGGSSVDHFEPDVINANDYYAFGMQMPGRKFAANNSYRYGFNGKENDNDVKGEGGQQDYGMRVYDTRLGRFLSVDPLTRSYPWYTPYQFAGNNPIKYIDLDGLEPAVKGDEVGTIMHGDQSGQSWKWDGENWEDNSTLETVTVTAKKKFKPVNFIYWPEINDDQLKWNDEMIGRIRDDEPYSKPDDPPWLAGQLPFHLQNYKAQQDGRILQGVFLGGMALPVAPLVTVEAVESGLAANAWQLIKPKFGLSPGGAIGDFINQKLVLGKSWEDYNGFSTVTNGILGGGSIIKNAVYGASGSFINYSVNDYYGGTMFKFNKSGLISFSAGFVGNVLSGGLSNRFNVLTGLGNNATRAAKGILISVDAANITWGNVIATQIETGLTK